MEKRIWLITGISSGLGKALAQAVIEHGDFVIGTFRKQSQTDSFNGKYKDQALALTLDITNTGDIENAIETIKRNFGKIDVLVNNAGYGFAGAIEERKKYLKPIFLAPYILPKSSCRFFANKKVVISFK
jgi:NAD(P)-dependent dehydrogenase (short-subunit alcohol dehydrogenase family)